MYPMNTPKMSNYPFADTLTARKEIKHMEHIKRRMTR